MARLRKAKNYLVMFLAIIVSATVSWLGFQPPAWAKRTAGPEKADKVSHVRQVRQVRHVRKTVKAPARKVVAKRSTKTSAARVKKAA